MKASVYRNYVKSILDFTLALMLLVLLSPLILLTAVAVYVKLGKPILFCQKRPGLNEKPFTIYKFRTMYNYVDGFGNSLSDEARLGNFGKLLRSTSLDELPELINVLKGEMSFIGPRPLLIKDVIFMDNNQKRRHSIKPGITGIAQISGRNELDWRKKLQLDLDYIDKVTFLNDVIILVKTLIFVIRRRGISTPGMATGEDYGDYLLRNGYISQEMHLKLLNGLGKM